MTLIEQGNGCRKLGFNIIVTPGNNEFITMVVIGNTKLKTMVDSIRKQRLYINTILIKENFHSTR
jgi:hypothetical protein